MTDLFDLQPMITFRLGVQSTDGKFHAVDMVVDTGAQISAIPRQIATSLNLRLEPTGKSIGLEMGDGRQQPSPLCQANLLVDVRDSKASILDGWKVAIIEGGSPTLGLDFLSRFEYRIADGALYLIKEKRIGPEPAA